MPALVGQGDRGAESLVCQGPPLPPPLPLKEHRGVSHRALCSREVSNVVLGARQPWPSLKLKFLLIVFCVNSKVTDGGIELKDGRRSHADRDAAQQSLASSIATATAGWP